MKSTEESIIYLFEIQAIFESFDNKIICIP